tara:strand:- start:755 stop:1159 length:405 start_codon:yes stop_codon:yes gene_type:complete
MKLQEIFDAASVHLMGMDGPSLDQDADACVYRGKDADCEFNGQKCAVGLFIDDEHYDDDLEGQGISGGQAVADAVAKSWGQDDLTVEQIRLLADLQNAHDDTSRGWEWPNSIVDALDKVATKFHLRFDPKGASA